MEYSLNSLTNTKIIYFEDQNSAKDKFLTDYFLKIKNLNSKILILTEEKISSKYKDYIENNLLSLKLDSKDNSLQFNVFFVKEGDFYKNQDIVTKITSYMLENSYDRSSCIVAFGGGKITDLAGYVASIYQRGIDCILIPSTLLSMVDASIGGKTGINDLKYGKNLIGTVYQPKM